MDAYDDTETCEHCGIAFHLDDLVPMSDGEDGIDHYLCEYDYAFLRDEEHRLAMEAEDAYWRSPAGRRELIDQAREDEEDARWAARWPEDEY